MVVTGLALGVGVALVVRGGAPAPSSRPNQGPSVTRFSFSDGTLPAVTAREPSTAGPTLTDEPSTPEAALTFFLTSMVEGRPEAAYAILDPPSRLRFPSLDSWTRAQSDLARPTGFEIGPARAAFGNDDRVEIEVVASHQPSLDPTQGLVPARSRGLWTVERREGAWRVGAEPLSVVPILPADDGATATVSAWVDRLQSCDRPGAASLQVSSYLYGPADFVRAPCDQQGSWTVGAVTGLDSAGDPRDLVAAFGPGVGSWARLVSVEGPGNRFYAVVAPMGDAWQVVGVAGPG